MTNNFSKFLRKKETEKKKRHIDTFNKDDTKVRSYRMQEEFGPKKFIKP